MRHFKEFKKYRQRKGFVHTGFSMDFIINTSCETVTGQVQSYRKIWTTNSGNKILIFCYTFHFLKF